MLKRLHCRYLGKRLFLLLLLAFYGAAFSQTIQVNMVKLKQLKAVERRGDELYLDIIGSTTQGKPTFLRIPKAPHHWPAALLTKLPSIVLWQGELKQGNGLSLVVSLIEKDAPPWNLDDLLGSVRVQLTNATGKVYLAMSRPNHDKTRDNRLLKDTFQHTFLLEDGKHGRYELTLAVKYL